MYLSTTRVRRAGVYGSRRGSRFLGNNGVINIGLKTSALRICTANSVTGVRSVSNNAVPSSEFRRLVMSISDGGGGINRKGRHRYIVCAASNADNALTD